MLSNAEHITLRFLEDTIVDISGSPDVVAQIVKRLDGIKIVLIKEYFGDSSNDQ